MSVVIAAIIMIISFILVDLPVVIIMSAIQNIGIFNRIEGDDTLPAAIFFSFFAEKSLDKIAFIAIRACSYILLGMLLSTLL